MRTWFEILETVVKEVGTGLGLSNEVHGDYNHNCVSVIVSIGESQFTETIHRASRDEGVATMLEIVAKKALFTLAEHGYEGCRPIQPERPRDIITELTEMTGMLIMNFPSQKEYVIGVTTEEYDIFAAKVEKANNDRDGYVGNFHGGEIANDVGRTLSIRISGIDFHVTERTFNYVITT